MLLDYPKQQVMDAETQPILVPILIDRVSYIHLTAKISLCLIFLIVGYDSASSMSVRQPIVIKCNNLMKLKIDQFDDQAASCNIFHLRLAGSVNHLKI